jgi:hypothetical protein
MQADLPQRFPVVPRTDGPQQTKDESRKDHLQAPKEALDARNQQSTARDRIYVVVQPMPAPGTAGTPYFVGQNVSQFIEQYERLCTRYHVTSIEKHQGLPEYCDYWIGMWIRSLPEFTAGDWTELVRKLRAEYRGSDHFRQMETVEFLEAYVLQCRSSPPSVREYCRQFALISQRATEAGNLDNRQRGYWFAEGLPLEYQRHAMAKTGADPDRRKSFDFYQLQRAVEDRLCSHEGADRLSKMDFEEQSLRQLVEQFCNQQPVISKDATLRPPVTFQPNKTVDVRQASQETDLELKELRQREGRLPDLARLGVQKGA